MKEPSTPRAAPPNGDVSALLRAWTAGDQQAIHVLTPIVYAELHRLARHYMRRERSDHSLQATSLVNEAYMRLADYTRMEWRDRAHFFAVSAQVMRRILVDDARRHNVKRGRGVQHVSLDDVVVVAPGGEAATNLVAIDEALVGLARIDARKAHIVEMRFFGGLTVEEIAEVLRVSSGTIKRDWRAAKAWLYQELTREQADGR
jgi:RNA polymerase sigma-70 factor (ECF subfamily)